MHVTGAKRWKTRASEARLVLVLLLIGWESGANFMNQSQSVVKQNQSKREVTFDAQPKTALNSSNCKSHLSMFTVFTKTFNLLISRLTDGKKCIIMHKASAE